jgi:hypothetical protein
MRLLKQPILAQTSGFGAVLALSLLIGCQPSPNLSGVWEVDKERSTHLGPWRNIELRITASEDRVAIGRLFNPRHRDERHDSISVLVDGSTVEIPLQPSAKWMEQPHLGVFIDGRTPMKVTSDWEVPGRVLDVERVMTLQTSQSEAVVDIRQSYALSDDGQELYVTESRSSRPGELTYVYTRK